MGLLDVAARAPAPTPAPHAGLVADRMDRIFGRQIDIATCGYVSGDFDSAVWCNLSYDCVQNTINNVRGCCLPPIDACTLATTCINSADLGADCDGACTENNFVMKCSSALSPLCFSRKWITTELDSTQLEWGCTDVADVDITVYTTITDLGFTSTIDEFSFSIPTETSVHSAINGGAVATGSGLDATGVASTGSSASHTSSASPNNSGGGGSGLSQGATIAIAVCAAVVGLAAIGLVGFLCWWRKRKTSVQPTNYGPGAPPMNSFPSPYAGYAPPPEHPPFDQPPMNDGGAYYSPSAVGVGKDNVHFSAVDDDQLARMRRFSNDGTVATIDQTVAGRTNDDFRPQGA